MPTLPTINSLEQLVPTLQVWRQKLNQTINAPVPPSSPFNFAAAGGATGAIGITLTWAIVRGADGYEIQSSTNGDFSTVGIAAVLSNVVATSF